MGNGKGPKLLMPGQQAPQGQVVGQGEMSATEVQARTEFEFAIMMSRQIQYELVIAADLVETYSGNESFTVARDAKRLAEEALGVHTDLAEMQIRMLRTVRSKLKKCAPFSGMNDLKFSGLEDAKKV